MPQDLNFALTPDQQDMRASIRAFISEHSPIEVAKAHQDGTVARAKRDLWSRLHDQYGAQGMCIPEEYGGLGFELDDLCVVLSEMGANLFAGPYWSTVALATPVLLAAEPNGVRDGWLRAIAEGRLAASVAHTSVTGTSPARSVTATRTGDEWHLTGRAGFVLDADVADLILVVAETVAGLQFFGITTAGIDIKTTSLDSIDPTRQVFEVEFDDAEAIPLLHAHGAESALLDATAYACVALGAEQVGGARRSLARTVEFAKQRVQFGKPIGSFQAVQHQCADALIAIEGAESAVLYAAWAHGDRSPEFTIASSVAKVAASEAFMDVATKFVHLSGTIGFTKEYDAQLYYRRAKWSSLYLGSSAAHRGRIADQLGI